MKKTAYLACIVVLLSACSNEPSADAVKQAFRSDYGRLLAQYGGSLRTVDSLTINSCQETPDKTYNCSFDVAFTYWDDGRQKTLSVNETKRAILSNKSGNWRMRLTP